MDAHFVGFGFVRAAVGQHETVFGSGVVHGHESLLFVGGLSLDDGLQDFSGSIDSHLLSHPFAAVTSERV